MTQEDAMKIPKTYLGDGVYAIFDGYHIVLTAEDGPASTNIIYLEPKVLEALAEYARIVNEAFVVKEKEQPG